MSNNNVILNKFGSLRLGMDVSELDPSMHEEEDSILCIRNKNDDILWIQNLENVKGIFYSHYKVTNDINLSNVTLFFYKDKLFYVQLSDDNVIDYLTLKYSFSKNLIRYQGYDHITKYDFVTNDDNIVCKHIYSVNNYIRKSTDLYLKNVYNNVVNEYNDHIREREASKELELINKISDF